MSPGDRRLLWHLVIAVAIKLVLLAGLWWAFVRDARVEVDPAVAARHLVAPQPAPGDGD